MIFSVNLSPGIIVANGFPVEMELFKCLENEPKCRKPLSKRTQTVEKDWTL